MRRVHGPVMVVGGRATVTAHTVGRDYSNIIVATVRRCRSGTYVRQYQFVAVAVSDSAYFSRNSEMSWPIFAYQSLSIRCMSSATRSGSAGR